MLIQAPRMALPLVSATRLVQVGQQNMAGAGGAWATQRAEWIALMAKREFPNADPTNLKSLGAPMQTRSHDVLKMIGWGRVLLIQASL